MRFANPAALWLAALAVPVIALHILRPRREAQVVSSTFLWRSIERPVTSATPFKRLRPSWLLFVQLLAVAGLAVALANPVRVEASPLAEHTVFLIDASGSMKALDGTPDRLAEAKQRADELYAELPTGGIASVIEVGPVPLVLLSASADAAAFTEAVAAIRATEGSGDFSGAFALALGLETADSPIGFVLLSDGGLTEEEQRLLPPGTTYRAIGSSATNRAIIDIDVEPRDGGLHVRVTVANLGGPRATQTLRLDVDRRTRERVELTLEKGATVVHETDLTLGDRVDAFLEGEDLIAADNRRWAVASRRQAIRVYTVGEIDPFVESVLGAIEGIEVVGDDDTDPADVTIIDGVRIPPDLSTPYLAITPRGGAPGIDLVGTVERPAVTLIRSTDPLLQQVDLSEVAIATSQRIETVAGEVLVGAESAPLLVRNRSDGLRSIYMAFRPAESNLPLQIAFPLLIDGILAELAGAALPPAAVEVGDTLVAPGTGAATFSDPSGRTMVLPAGSTGLIATEPGIWTIAALDRPTMTVAVNPAAAESRVTPVPALPTEKRVLRPGEAAPASETSLRIWVIAALLVLIAIELLLARRSVGVSRRQWNAALVLRALAVIALIGALFDFGFDRSGENVATVFVVDASDSMGVSGRSDAVDFVQDALADQPGGALAGVVLFGSDARIEALLQTRLRIDAPTVRIDPTRTDLAAALRLGAAILPDANRRRVVLVSDGRNTEGDATAEAARLSEAGVSVDVVLVDSPAGSDIAVGALRTPSRVAENERFRIDVPIDSTVAGPALVNLFDDGQLVESRTVELVAGSQVVRFDQTADAGGTLRFEVEVQSRLDLVAQNNRAFAAVQVEGRETVLVIEGYTDAGADLAGALTAGGLIVETIAVNDLPNLDRLVEYSSMVLVDVEERSLTDRQVAALGSAVRDGGRGLVTVGGTHSYGLGGYYTSDLERLLPVISEILDPKRRQSVAEVLAVDTSGSMGACHCSLGQFKSNRLDGGVNKTDISRAAAARTIEALSQNDEIGVLGFDVEERWIIELQQLPSQDVVNKGLSQLSADGGTNPLSTLEESAAALRESKAALKHIILFTDGFTSQAILSQLAEQAANIFAEGITVSVVATGEGAARELNEVAVAGGGRFYPGRDIQQIPEIIMEEAVIASRDFVNEGEYLPTITSTRPVVASLESSPPLLGYVATTAKPGATTLLRIGPDDDPLLATWRAGLGRTTSWTSDASDRWSKLWANWDGYVEFWSKVVRDTFPILSEGTSASVIDGILQVRVEGQSAFADDAAAMASVTSPDLGTRKIPLDRVGPDTFVTELPVDDAGVYIVGTTVTSSSGAAIGGSALTTQSYGREYAPGEADASHLARIADAGGGRVDIDPTMAFDRAGLTAGRSHVALAGWLLLLAAGAFAVAVVTSRLTQRVPASPAIARRTRKAKLSTHKAAETEAEPPKDITSGDTEILREIADEDAKATSQTLSTLLETTRALRRGDDPDSADD